MTTLGQRALTRIVVEQASTAVDTPCWLWQGARTSMGYGNLVSQALGARMLVHRAVWIDANGPVPAGLELDHLCRVRHCCRPDHLEAVTHAENIRRGFAAVRAAA
jgi:hypothetical protein